MRYCNHCKHVTPGEPLYCQNCSRTYDVRLCPRHHVNPRSAQVCSQCGSPDLSTPQPKRGFGVGLSMLLLRILVSRFTGWVILLSLVVYFFYFIGKALQNVNNLLPEMTLGAALGALFLGWMILPNFIREGATRFAKGSLGLTRKKRK